jgi:ATP-dependent Clp protease ATP-binding subunit ClpX
VKLCNDILEGELEREQPSASGQLPKPAEIKRILDDYVVGQDRAKNTLAIAVCNHYKRIYSPPPPGEVGLEKRTSSCRPTGTGKTLLRGRWRAPKSRSRHRRHQPQPVTWARIEAILVRLLSRRTSNGQRRAGSWITRSTGIRARARTLHHARRLGRRGSRRCQHLWGHGRQRAAAGGRKSAGYIEVNTRDILFICGGAFEGLEKIIEKRVGQKTMGFGAAIQSKKDRNQGEMLAQVEPEDLLKYGLIPELVGRLPVVGVLDSLDEDSLVSILTEPKNAITKQYQKF